MSFCCKCNAGICSQKDCDATYCDCHGPRCGEPKKHPKLCDCFCPAPKAKADEEEECESCLDFRRVLQVVACTVAVVDGPIPSKEELDATWDLVNAVLQRNRHPSQPSPNAPQEREAIEDLKEKIAELEFELDKLANEMVYRGNSVAYIYDKKDAYANALEKTFQVLSEFGFDADGKTPLWDLVKVALTRKERES